MRPSSGMCLNGIALRRSARLAGKSALRRSPRLLDQGKSAMTMPKPSRTISRRKTRAMQSARTMPKSPRKNPAKGYGATFCSSYGGIEKIMRAGREHEAKHFKKIYKIKNDCLEKKMCIHPGGSFNWFESSFGITWVAFQGTNTTCVAFRKTLEPVKDRLTSYLEYNPASVTFDFLGTAIISEIEVLADLPSELTQKFPETCNGQHVHAPFAIVSVVPNTKTDKGENVDEEAAVDFLKGIIKKDKFFYPDKPREAAVNALQRLYRQTFKPEDIWVHESCFGREEGLSDDSIMHLLNWVNGVYPPLMEIAGSYEQMKKFLGLNVC